MLGKKTRKNLSTSGSSCTRAERRRRRHIKAALWTLCGDDSLHDDAPLAKPPAFEGENRQMSCNQAAGENTFTPPEWSRARPPPPERILMDIMGWCQATVQLLSADKQTDRQTDRIQGAQSRHHNNVLNTLLSL